jgi:SHS2 domain-containing protein
MKKSGYEYKDHTADVQARCYGPTLEKAFEQAAYSLIATISPNLKQIAPIVNKSIRVSAEDKQALLFDFLTEFLYIFDVDELIFSKIIVKNIEKLDNGYILIANAIGEKFDKSKHKIGIEVKAITYSYMNIEEHPNNVIIDVVFDI